MDIGFVSNGDALILGFMGFLGLSFLGGLICSMGKPVVGLPVAIMGCLVLAGTFYSMSSVHDDNIAIAQEWSTSAEAEDVCVEQFTEALDGRSLELASYDDDNEGYYEWDQLQESMQPYGIIAIENPFGSVKGFGFYYDEESEQQMFDCYSQGKLDSIPGVNELQWESKS